MKIALVFDGLQIGGIERVGADYAKILCSLGHDVTIINLMPTLNEMKNEFPIECKFQNFYYSRKFTSAQYAQLVKKGFKGTLLYLILMIILPFAKLVFKTYFFTKFYSKRKFDISIAFSGHFNDLDFVASNFTKSTSKMCWLHGALYSYLLISYGYMGLYQKIRNLIVLVDDAQEECLMYNKDLLLKIKKLYNPTLIKSKTINIEHVKELKKKYGRFLLMVSRFVYPHKDQYTVAEMLKIVREHYQCNVDLVFVGNGPEEESVKKFVAKFSPDIQKHIHFEGSRFDVQDYYKAAYMLVHASIAGEGLPTVILEAMEYELPMVVTDSKTGPREILGENEYGLLCKVNNPQDMADKVYKLINDSDLYNSYKGKSRIRVQDFSETKIKKQLSIILSQLERE